MIAGELANMRPTPSILARNWIITTSTSAGRLRSLVPRRLLKLNQGPFTFLARRQGARFRNSSNSSDLLNRCETDALWICHAVKMTRQSFQKNKFECQSVRNMSSPFGLGFPTEYFSSLSCALLCLTKFCHISKVRCFRKRPLNRGWLTHLSPGKQKLED